MNALLRTTMAIALMAVAGLAHAELSAKKVKKDIPEGVSKAIAATLQAEAIEVSDGGEALYDFWFVKSLELKGKPSGPEEALEQIKEMTLLGVAVAHVEQYDYRDDAVRERTYVMRFALQPMDGNHLGTSEYDSFSLFLPAEIDTEVEQWDDPDDMVDASAGETAAEHPIILLMRPVEAEESDPKVASPAEEEVGVTVSIPAKAGGEETNVPFILIVEGHGEL